MSTNARSVITANLKPPEPCQPGTTKAEGSRPQQNSSQFGGLLDGYSFPSGHSAAALAGATLLQSRYPRGRQFFFAIALLVAFSRIYLGAHYPGDVLSGGLTGTALAKLYRSLCTNLRRSSTN